jgi:undecaprenyl diphosphate synthase
MMQSNLHEKLAPAPARDLAGKLHVGIIMDGNGRWAARRGMPRTAGHRAGVEAIRRVVEAAPEQSVGTLTLFAFSSNNWRRPQSEVSELMDLLRRYLAAETTRLAESGIRLRVIGRRDRLPMVLAHAIGQAERETAAGDRLYLRVAIDYSARAAILDAASRILSADDQTHEGFARLVTGEAAPRDVDLLIRTSGEQRLSDFLLWESAHAEFYFTDAMWPDFDGLQLAKALAAFRARERTFGGLPAPAAA